MAISKEQRDARRAAGLCVRCGAPAEQGPLGPRSLCTSHLQAARERQLRRHDEHLEAGICVRCSSPAELGLTMCGHHAAATSTYQVARRIEHNEAGWCVRCGYEAPAEPDHTLCAKHIEVDRQEGWAERQGGKTDEDRARRARYREQGLCPLCGDSPAPDGVLCPRHAEKSKQDSQLHRDRQRNQRRVT